MNAVFMNSENSEISDPLRLLLILRDKIDLRRKDCNYCFMKFQHLLCMEKK